MNHPILKTAYDLDEYKKAIEMMALNTAKVVVKNKLKQSKYYQPVDLDVDVIKDLATDRRALNRFQDQ